jgi:hypothetical protein
MGARTTRTELTEQWKERIKAGVILDRLTKHVAGKIKMSTSQVRAADILLKKVMPDLSKADVDNTHSGNVNVNGSVKFVRPNNKL